MDNVRGFENRIEDDQEPDVPIDQPTIEIGSDERRMHVRAYNHWVSLLQGRAYPSIADLDPANIADFGPHSVLLDFSHGVEDPAIAFLGRALRQECDLDSTVTMISQVPSRSLLSRLTDHYLQIIANCAPIGFEAEFVGSRGHSMMYRGILMPFSSDGVTIDFIYGVINWKELVTADAQARLEAEVAESVRAAPRLATAAPAWADGPSAERDDGNDDAEAPLLGDLADQLSLAQQNAAAVRAADTRGRAALHRALGRAHDFAAAADRDPHGYEALLDQAGIAVQLRAPMTPIVKLVFGADYDRTRLTDYATVLSHARRLGIAAETFGDFLDGFDGGIKGVVKAERALRQPRTLDEDYSAAFDDRPSLADVSLHTGLAGGDYVMLLARAGDDGTLEIVATLDDAALIDQAMRAAI